MKGENVPQQATKTWCITELYLAGSFRTKPRSTYVDSMDFQHVREAEQTADTRKVPKSIYTLDRQIYQDLKLSGWTWGPRFCSGDVPEPSDKVAVVELPERVQMAEDSP